MAHRFPVKCTGVCTDKPEFGHDPSGLFEATFEGPAVPRMFILTDQPFIVGRNYAIDIVKQAER